MNSKFQKLKLSKLYTEEYIRKNADRLDWTDVARYRNFLGYSDELITDFIDDWDWTEILMKMQLPESIIRKYSDKLSWELLCFYQSLSEDLIRDFSNKVCWEYISKYQNLSEEFCIEFADKINLSDLFYNNNSLKNIGDPTKNLVFRWPEFITKILEKRQEMYDLKT